MKEGILLCFHGTKSHEGVKDTNKLLKTFKKENKKYTIKIGYLEIRKPTIKNQLDFFFKRKFDNLLIIPAMIFSGNHVTKDIPKIVKNFKKRYKNTPKIKFISPLSKAKNFFNIIQNNLFKILRLLNKKKDYGLIVVASYTINFKAISEIKLLAKKIAKKNKFSFYKKILITLNKEDLKQELSNLNLNYKYIILPIFLFRGKLLENLISVVKEKNKKNQKKFILCNHLNNYKNIQNLMQNLIKSKIT